MFRGYRDRRIKQLAQINSIDEKLKSIELICPHVVIDYYRTYRNLNYVSSMRVYDSGITNLWENTSVEMDLIDKHHLDIIQILSEGEAYLKCMRLSHYK